MCFPLEDLQESLETPKNINFHVPLKCFTRVVLRGYLKILCIWFLLALVFVTLKDLPKFRECSWHLLRTLCNSCDCLSFDKCLKSHTFQNFKRWVGWFWFSRKKLWVGAVHGMNMKWPEAHGHSCVSIWNGWGALHCALGFSCREQVEGGWIGV